MIEHAISVAAILVLAAIVLGTCSPLKPPDPQKRLSPQQDDGEV